MVNNIKALVIQQIKEVFGNLKVYDEEIKQGLITPAFLVLMFNLGQERKLKRQVLRSYMCNVTYFPGTEDIHSEIDAVFEIFQNEFQYIGNQFHINRLESEKVDRTLVITFTVDVLLKEVVEGTKMQSLGDVSLERRKQES